MVASPVFVSIENLAKTYGAFVALRGISFDVKAGEIFGFLGPNGAGKTTTLSILAGLLPATSGRVTVCGFDVATQALQAKQCLGYIPDRPYVYEKLTGREVFQMFGELYGISDADIVAGTDHWLGVFGLTSKADDLVDSYSHGMRQRLVLGATLLCDPAVLVLDEPMVGLDPQGARLLKDLLLQRCRNGKAVLMSTHTLQVAEEMCHRVCVINKGQIVAIGSVDELRAQAQTQGATGSLEDIFLRMTNGHLV